MQRETTDRRGDETGAAAGDGDTVYAAAQDLLEERAREQGEADVAVTGTEIAQATGITKPAVVEALRELSADRLYVSVLGGHEVEVHGVRHGRLGALSGSDH